MHRGNLLFGSKNERGRTLRRTFSQILFHRHRRSFSLPLFPPLLPFRSVVATLFESFSFSLRSLPPPLPFAVDSIFTTRIEASLTTLFRHGVLTPATRLDATRLVVSMERCLSFSPRSAERFCSLRFSQDGDLTESENRETHRQMLAERKTACLPDRLIASFGL